MQERLKKLSISPFFIVGIVGMVVLFLFHDRTSIYYYLTVAQLLYVPLVVERVVTLSVWQKACIISGQLAVVAIYFVQLPALSLILSIVYFISMLAVFWSGVLRFLQRGFIHIEEIVIDIGLVYSVMAGVWYFIHVNGINTGFSEIITWLTAIHFHYSAMLLCITVGLLGRYIKPRLYPFCASIIAAGPMLVAIGITLSRVVEIVSVTLYVMAIFILAYYTWKIKKRAMYFIRIAFLTLCFTIIWSFLYAYSNLTGSALVTIPDMLAFHGILNCIIFGGAIAVAWSMEVPTTHFSGFQFPRSDVKGKLHSSGEPHHALVDNMAVFVDKTTVPNMLTDFYENTSNYELHATVKWSNWFKPFAFVYQWISKWMQQLNLPFRAVRTKMNGEIFKLNNSSDTREAPRVWQRKINDATVFTAIYAIHKTNGKPYMNIALPLPRATMHGILTVNASEGKLYLTSDDTGDAGTYLSIAGNTLKLPLHEYFILQQKDETLEAMHEMKLFGLKFLQIAYEIKGTNSQERRHKIIRNVERASEIE